jgi:carbonic anhydrase
MSELEKYLFPSGTIPEIYKSTPIEKLVRYHNEKLPFDLYDKAEIIIATCMDNRVNIRIPEKFAYVIRNGGACIKYSNFHISYAIAAGKIKYFCLIGHTDCGMVKLKERKQIYINGIIENAGWNYKDAEDFFERNISIFEIDNEVVSVSNEVKRLRKEFPLLTVCPMLYRVEDNLLYFIKEN